MVEDKRAKILSSAEEIMSEKSMVDATISEIAARAGVADSVIYQYFKSKEDLLFSVPGERMKEVLFLLREHLQGIRDSESRLSKMIWFHLRDIDTHPGYGRILILECRSSPEFYLTPAYQLVKEYAYVMYGILDNGIKDGSFRSDLNVKVVRDIILGTLDMEVISSLALGEIEESTGDLDDIMSLIHAMITSSARPICTKADRILRAAEKVFAEKGFTKAKISEIAKIAGISEASVYEYFENKEDVFLSIPRHRFQENLYELSETFHIKNPIRKLKRFTKYYFFLMLTEEDFLKVFLFQLQLNPRFYRSKAFESFQRYFRVVEEIIEEGKEKGCFRPDVNPRVFRNMFFGAFSHLALRWMMFHDGRGQDKIQEINHATNLFCSAVMAYRGDED
ncbi:MAG: TetR/AcrR family transcriptional regulator [Desulfomonilia bacterium]|jgi:TetR/AcrR family fatty acid metabolism transcriptional regulator